MLITVVGNYPKIPNLPRPARLRNAYARLDRGDIAPEETARVEDEVTKEVIKEQEDAGIELVTDGQIRWLDELTYLAGRLDGVQINGLIRFFDTNMYYRQPVVPGFEHLQKILMIATKHGGVTRVELGAKQEVN